MLEREGYEAASNSVIIGVLIYSMGSDYGEIGVEVWCEMREINTEE